ncbi:MAG: hypothetical protein KatS3mg129_3213 [Leptospiraceae bacterium]|nr:MAG: hypothetical protein KatS3mg129_3213 [Leptospiraceae bacterium]
MNPEQLLEEFDFKAYDILPLPLLVTQDWKILYANLEAKQIFNSQDLVNKSLLEYLTEEQKNFFKFQMALIKPERTHSFSILLNIENRMIPAICLIKLLKDEHNKCYFFITLQKIEGYEEKFQILSKIVLDTFTLLGKELYEKLLKKIVDSYDLDGIFLLVSKNNEFVIPKNNTNENFILASYKKDSLEIDFQQYIFSEKLQKRIDKFGSLLIEREFSKQYPDDSLAKLNIQSLIGIKINIRKSEKLYIIAFSKKTITNLSELHFTLNVCSVKIISEYLREYHYLKYENFYNTFLHTNDAVFLYHAEKDKIIDCNPAFNKLLNLSSEQVLEHSIFDLIGDEFSKRYKKIFWYSYYKNKLKNGKVRLYIKNSLGIEIPVEVFITYIKSKNETIMLGIMRDLTYAIQAVEEHKKYLQTLSLLQLHVIELDENLNVLYVNYIPNSKFPKLSKFSNFLDIILEDYKEYVKIVLTNLFKTKKSIRIRFPVKVSKSRNDWYEADFVLIKSKKKKYIRGIIKDITLEYISEKQFILIAEHDLLTSLPNRNRLEEDLYKAILRADKNRTSIAVGFLDLDKFFHVNELLGHRFGDLVLSLFADRLRQMPEISHSVYRWGGDQFVFFIENIKNKSDIFGFLERLKQLSKEPIIIEGEKFFITYTVGISLYPNDGMTIDALFGEADKAMNYGKQSGRFQFVFASNLPRRSTTLSKFEIQSHILEAISEKKVQPYFQPIYDIKKNKISGMEALARLTHYNKDLYIGPDIFIPMAEDLGLIEELSYYVIKKSFEFFKKLYQKYKIYLSINISRRLLHSDLFIMNLFDIQQELDIDTSGIVIEVTESLAMLDKESSLKKLFQLKELGYKIAIDDFGTGYSSLAELQELPIDIIKIDKIFIRRLKNDEHNRILDAIILLAQNLNLEIIAEGVEDIQTLKKLNKLGIQYAQGFFYAPPLTEKDFINKIENDEIMNLHYLS